MGYMGGEGVCDEERYVRPRALLAAAWRTGWDAWVRDAVRGGGRRGGEMREGMEARGEAVELEGAVRSMIRGGGTVRRQHRVEQVSRVGTWWVRVRDTPAVEATAAMELEEDAPLLGDQDAERRSRAQAQPADLSCSVDGAWSSGLQQCGARGAAVRHALGDGTTCGDVGQRPEEQVGTGWQRQGWMGCGEGEQHAQSSASWRSYHGLRNFITERSRQFLMGTLGTAGTGTVEGQGAERRGAVNGGGGESGTVGRVASAVVERCKRLFFRDTG